MVKSYNKQNILNFGCTPTGNTATLACAYACAQNDRKKIACENNKMQVTIATLVSLLSPRTPQ